MAAWPGPGAVQPVGASFRPCLGTGRHLCSETETTRKVTGELHWSVEKQVRTESKDIASEAGERKCSSLEENGLTTLQHFFSLTCCLQSKFSRGFQDKWARDIWILFSQKLRCLPQ